ncbi:MAG TPA: hypothetical protein VHS09_08975 [Polyangiaceae bacterium]|jgi:hypothetical protein|nr:hypothetical protein [Polyangiaceae bacterium]
MSRPHSPDAGARPWRCHTCSALLGVLRQGELHVKYRDVEHWIAGRCRHSCRRCGATNTVESAPSGGGAR